MDINKIMEQAQKFQSKLEEIQNKLADIEVEYTSGLDEVTAVVNGKHELLRLNISDKTYEKNNKKVLEDLIIAAINGAMRRADDKAKSEITAATGGIKMPFNM